MANLKTRFLSNKKGEEDTMLGPKQLVYVIIILVLFFILWMIISSVKGRLLR